MLKTMAEKAVRQEEMKRRLEAVDEVPDLLSVDEVAAILRVHRQTARQIVLHEKGVHRIPTPGSRRPIIRVPREVVDRLLKRTANP
jgi:predicted transcriptional regulator of viral defense system